MKIIIAGCGKVGYALAQQLNEEGHDLTLIDNSAERLQPALSNLDLQGVVGNASSFLTLLEADIEHTDLLIAVTGSDELNLLCCTIAKQVGDCAAIARVRTPDYSQESGYLREKLGLAMIINPEMEAALEMARILYLPTALKVSPFAHGQAELIQYKIPKGNILDGITLAQLSAKVPDRVLVCAIERDGKVEIPSGLSEMRAGDVISFVAQRVNVKNFMQNISVKNTKVKNTMIIGGGKAAYYLASRLLYMGISVKIIERDRKRCEELSVLLPKAIIINGDGTDAELLKEEGIDSVESFVPLTGMDEENIMLTLHARQLSDAKVITKINRLAFKNVIAELNLGSVIYPRLITSESIIAYVRAKRASIDSNLETLYYLFDGHVEALEFSIDEASKVTDVPLMQLKLKEQVLVAFINRNGRIILPSGQDSIQVGDTVMIVTTHHGFDEIEDILR